jgi:hypothetical protein
MTAKPVRLSPRFAIEAGGHETDSAAVPSASQPMLE